MVKSVQSGDLYPLHNFASSIKVNIDGERKALKGSVLSLAKASQIEDLMMKEFEEFKDDAIQSTPMKFMYELYKPHI